MQKYILAIVMVAMFAVAPKLSAWECTSTGASGGCYVELIEVHTADNPSANETYVIAQIKDPKNRTDVTKVRAKKGVGQTTVDTIQATMQQLIISLSLGLPINFTCSAKSNGICDLEVLVVSTPGF